MQRETERYRKLNVEIPTNKSLIGNNNISRRRDPALSHDGTRFQQK